MRDRKHEDLIEYEILMKFWAKCNKINKMVSETLHLFLLMRDVLILKDSKAWIVTSWIVYP